MGNNNKERVVIYLRKDLKRKLDDNVLKFEKKTLSHQVNELLDYAFNNKLQDRDEDVLNALATKIINVLSKANTDTINDFKKEQQKQFDIVQALLKSIKMYSVANNNVSDVDDSILQVKKSAYIENDFRETIEKIQKKK